MGLRGADRSWGGFAGGLARQGSSRSCKAITHLTKQRRADHSCTAGVNPRPPRARARKARAAPMTAIAPAATRSGPRRWRSTSAAQPVALQVQARELRERAAASISCFGARRRGSISCFGARVRRRAPAVCADLTDARAARTTARRRRRPPSQCRATPTSPARHRAATSTPTSPSSRVAECAQSAPNSSTPKSPFWLGKKATTPKWPKQAPVARRARRYDHAPVARHDGRDARGANRPADY